VEASTFWKHYSRLYRMSENLILVNFILKLKVILKFTAEGLKGTIILH